MSTRWGQPREGCSMLWAFRRNSTWKSRIFIYKWFFFFFYGKLFISLVRWLTLSLNWNMTQVYARIDSPFTLHCAVCQVGGRDWLPAVEQRVVNEYSSTVTQNSFVTPSSNCFLRYRQGWAEATVVNVWVSVARSKVWLKSRKLTCRQRMDRFSLMLSEKLRNCLRAVALPRITNNFCFGYFSFLLAYLIQFSECNESCKFAK